jgi:anaerobic magnesium-protoporphyrin IX monomethyl ester cyclase
MAHPDLSIRNAMSWYYRIGRRVWPFEMWNFFFREQRQEDGPTLAEFWGEPHTRKTKTLRANAKEWIIEPSSREL